MQRWIRAPNAKPTKDMFTVTPLSGSAYTVWPVMHQYLTKKKLKSVNQDEALSLVKKGAVLLDVRLAMDFDSEHAAGAVNVPLFRLTAGDGTWDKVKRVVMAGLNMRPTGDFRSSCDSCYYITVKRKPNHAHTQVGQDCDLFLSQLFFFIFCRARSRLC